MEPLDEKELSQLLRRWEAPSAAPSLALLVLPPREPWWKWLLTGTIRIPAPVGAALLVLLALWAYYSVPQASAPVPPPPAVSLADFQPVNQLEPKIVRRPQ